MIDKGLLLELLAAEYELEAIAVLGKHGLFKEANATRWSRLATCRTTNPSFTRNSLRRRLRSSRSSLMASTLSSSAGVRPKLSIRGASARRKT